MPQPRPASTAAANPAAVGTTARGAIAGSVAAAALMIVLVGISAAIYSHTIQNWILIFGGNDLSLLGVISYYLGLIFGG